MPYDPDKPSTPPVSPNVKPVDSHDKPAVKPANDGQQKADTPSPNGVKPTEIVQPVNDKIPPLPKHADKDVDTLTPKKTSPQRH